VKAVKREVRACIRFTRPEYFIIKEKAGKVGMSPSGYLRHLGIHTIIISRLTNEEREAARMLIGMANNMNQIAKACHQEGALRAMLYFESYRKHLDEILKKLKA
jgi:Bacterial mobilisation protein (MobC)